jgi:hypothetical protein
MGMFNNALSSDHAVIMAFGRSQVLDIRLGTEAPRQNNNVLYYVPVSIGIEGHVSFSSDLLRSTVLDADAQFFSKERFFLSLGGGSATLAYQPIPFEGSFDPTAIRLALSSGGGIGPLGRGKDVEPLPTIPAPCTDANNSLPEGCEPRRDDFLPEVEVFDLRGEGAWVRLPRLAADTVYNLVDPDRYADPATGQVLIRFVNDNPQLQAGFGFQLLLEGDIE